jgi:hypothetical protein
MTGYGTLECLQRRTFISCQGHSYLLSLNIEQDSDIIARITIDSESLFVSALHIAASRRLT